MSAALPPLPPPELIFFDAALQSPVQGYTISQTRAYATQARADLEAEVQQLREALIDIKYGLEGARIWGGMEWTYNPLHPFKYLPLIAKAEAALKEQP